MVRHHAALGGRAHLDVAASGNGRQSAVVGCRDRRGSLRIDAPQYGISATNGRCARTSSPTGIALDDVHFTGGDGSFTATGLIACPASATAAPTHVAPGRRIAFASTNRPDLRLVVDGDGPSRCRTSALRCPATLPLSKGHRRIRSDADRPARRRHRHQGAHAAVARRFRTPQRAARARSRRGPRPRADVHRRRYRHRARRARADHDVADGCADRRAERSARSTARTSRSARS